MGSSEKTLTAHAFRFAADAVAGAVEMAQGEYDPIMMDWEESEHADVIDAARKIRDRLREVARKVSGG